MNILSFSLSCWLNDYAIGHILPLDCLLLRMHQYLIPQHVLFGNHNARKETGACICLFESIKIRAFDTHEAIVPIFRDDNRRRTTDHHFIKSSCISKFLIGTHCISPLISHCFHVVSGLMARGVIVSLVQRFYGRMSCLFFNGFISNINSYL